MHINTYNTLSQVKITHTFWSLLKIMFDNLFGQESSILYSCMMFCVEANGNFLMKHDFIKYFVDTDQFWQSFTEP